jgi:GTP-binding protein HflX
LIDASEDLRDIRIKYITCWQVLEELKVDRSKVLVVFTKYDRLGSEEVIGQIAANLRISDPIVISSKSGYGIHKLKTMMSQHSKKSAINIHDAKRQ